jgi:hypothetical protein
MAWRGEQAERDQPVARSRRSGAQEGGGEGVRGVDAWQERGVDPGAVPGACGDGGGVVAASASSPSACAHRQHVVVRGQWHKEMHA